MRKTQNAGIAASMIISLIFIYMGIHTIYITAQTDGPIIKYYLSGISIIIFTSFIIAQVLVLIKP